MLRDSFTYAARSLIHRRLRSWLTVIGIFIGIAAVVGLISLGQGLRGAVAEQFSALGAQTLVIQPQSGGFGPPGVGSAVKLDKSDLKVVQQAQYVQLATGRLLKPVTVQFNRKAVTAFLASLPDDRAQRDMVLSSANEHIESGRQLLATDRGRVVLGAGFAAGGQYAKTFGTPVQVGDKIDIAGTKFEVTGILGKKGNPQSDQAILMNEPDMRALLNLSDEYSFIVAEADSIQDVNAARDAIEKDLRKHRNVKPRQEDFTVQTSQDILNTVDSVLGIVTGVLVGIAAISLLVGGIGIMNTMYTAVLERRKEIGIMKAVGATNAQVLQRFLIESGMLGMVGGGIGVLIGVGMSKLVELGASQALGPSVLKATSPWWLIVGALAFSFVVGTLSGILPARQAARLPPVEALR